MCVCAFKRKSRKTILTRPTSKWRRHTTISFGVCTSVCLLPNQAWFLLLLLLLLVLLIFTGFVIRVTFLEIFFFFCIKPPIFSIHSTLCLCCIASGIQVEKQNSIFSRSFSFRTYVSSLFLNRLTPQRDLIIWYYIYFFFFEKQIFRFSSNQHERKNRESKLRRLCVCVCITSRKASFRFVDATNCCNMIIHANKPTQHIRGRIEWNNDYYTFFCWI